MDWCPQTGRHSCLLSQEVQLHLYATSLSQLNEGGSPAVSQVTASSGVDDGGYSTPEEFNEFAWDGDEAGIVRTPPSASYASVVSSSKYIVSSTAPSCPSSIRPSPPSASSSTTTVFRLPTSVRLLLEGSISDSTPADITTSTPSSALLVADSGANEHVP
ncbi:predicted protein [Thalassiosira pseudonana CCMP1335]|uniref:Uncharacterized protein n=1 Tax=Thalassiosira pseudonana TaxID=35128 RepID=B8CDF0_THAPS|nr:predicted protein [Thalassiosira pseudonana CCMP1335]EED88443.1 predicted protein [Thalassiosira pseudonana CCMP1335]